ncbi:MAG: putative toxin-antitoxin system toxin component, PIN family [Cytophagaceae bacterium]|nr:putative toxin-antitoxin system toxin component, PIN family [Cytophagaceae bacterium]
MKVVVDTNIWVSLAIGSKSITYDFFELLNSTNIEFIVCEGLIDEIVATLEKEKIRNYLSKDRVILLFDILENHTSSFISHSKNTFL